MFSFKKMPLPQLGLRGLEADLSEEEAAIQDVVHCFAEEVMRPIGAKLDEMSPEEVIAPDSPLWDYQKQLHESGILDLETIATMDKTEKSRLIPIIFEELGWGDSGLTIFTLATAFPAFQAYATGDPELIETFGSRIGCWLGTQPDRGSDLVDADGQEVAAGQKQSRPNLSARVDGDEVIINGQSSAWITGGPVAQTALAYLPCDYGDGIYAENGTQHQIAILIDLEQPGVSKGKCLNKMGQRPLPQGEIFFDDVRVPMRNVLSKDSEDALGSFYGALTFGNMEMAATFTGVARAAFDHALAYVHERKQGGTAIINHQSVRMRVFDLWRKVEACRGLAQRVFDYNYSANGPHLLGSITSKTFVTNTAFEVASDALQLFGGNGLTKEYPIEKIMRDARAAMIEDGENNILSLKGAGWLSEAYKDANE
jgi:acyl-CoA dehydrogenase